VAVATGSCVGGQPSQPQERLSTDQVVVLARDDKLPEKNCSRYAWLWRAWHQRHSAPACTCHLSCLSRKCARVNSVSLTAFTTSGSSKLPRAPQ
jgi:hypothetical protein